MSAPSSDSEARDAVVEEDGVVARTVDLLKQGALGAALALVLVSSFSVALVVGGGLLVVESALDRSSLALGVALAFAGAGTLPVALHVGPLAVFALALEARPRLVATLGRIRRAAGALFVAGMTTLISLAFLGLACALAAEGLGSVVVTLGLAPIVIVLFLVGAWLQGASLVLVARAMVASALRAPRGQRATYHELAAGLVGHATILAIAGPNVARGVLTAAAARIVSAAVALVALPLAAILGSAIAVAIAGRPRHREGEGDGR